MYKNNVNQIYAIELEDYSVPVPVPMTKTYYGTLEDISELIACLTEDENTATEYASTIHAFEEFCNGNLAATHIIAEKELRLLTPVKTLYEETILMGDAKWIYNNGAICSVPMQADFVDVHQVLLQDEDRYIRCMRPCFEGLHLEHPQYGHCKFGTVSMGFPCIYKEFHEDDALNMRLFVIEQIAMTADECMSEMGLHYRLDFTNACNDLFGNKI